MKTIRLNVVAPRRALASLLLIMGLSAPAAAFDFDIDQDGQAQPLTDGLLMIRYWLFRIILDERRRRGGR